MHHQGVRVGLAESDRSCFGAPKVDVHVHHLSETPKQHAAPLSDVSGPAKVDHFANWINEQPS